MVNNLMKNLPVNDVLLDIKQALEKNQNLILQAPPGAGKSTLVPLSLLNETYLENKMIIMLEPRRLAARKVAEQMAKNLGEKVGLQVGYQVKMHSCYSKHTKLLVVTEAILIRKLQSDASLENVGLIIFDEFHERSIHTDLSLALSLQVQELLRDDLKLLLMSATLNSSELTSLLGNVPIITSKGKTFEVQNVYLDASIKQPDFRSINTVLLKTINKALKEDEGDILVFLAGAKEIKNLQKLLDEKLSFQNIQIYPLYSNLSQNEQDKALEQSNKRKIILSTNIAQTSLTIEGVKVVIDSGLEKLSFYNASTSMNHLDTVFISNDSAIQRAGRAGRLSEGKCYKLWHSSKILQSSSKPEILRSDLSSFYLDVSLWGVNDIKELKLLDYPSKKMESATKTVLYELKMIDEYHKITSFGKKTLRLGVHPRFAFMIQKANEWGFAYEGCLLSAILTEKDIFQNSSYDSDIYSRFIALYEKKLASNYVNVSRAKNVLVQADFFYKKFQNIEKTKQCEHQITQEQVSILLLFAYPDRLARIRVKNDIKYKLSNSKGAMLYKEDVFFNEEFLVVPALSAQNKDSYISLASKISLQSIEKEFYNDITIKDSITYNKESKRFDIKEKHFFYELELYNKAISFDKKYDFSKLICELLKQEGLELLTWSNKALDLQNRMNFINKHLKNSTFPSFEKSDLKDNLEFWLKPYLSEVKSIKELESLDLYSILLSQIPWDFQKSMDELAPSHIKVPSGSKIKIDYSNISTPILAVKIQEIFGLHDTPKVLNQSITLQIHLLSPALRPIQITYDLKSFWENSYDEVRKELFSKYKKHYWPTNPYEAVATNKTKKNM